MAEEYVVLSDPALVNGVEYEAGAVVPIDDTISDEFGTAKTQVHADYTAALWTSNNPTMTASQFGIESDTGRSKIGDNATAWVSLAYAPTVFEVADPVYVNEDFSTYAAADDADLADTVILNKGGVPYVATLTQLKTIINV